MPLYHITLHAYRSWNADHTEGYMRRDRNGIQAPDKPLAEARDRIAKHTAFEIDPVTQQFPLVATREAATRRQWDLYGVTATVTRVHAVISVKDDPDGYSTRNALKSALGYQLAKRNNTSCRRYFSRGGIPERIKDQHHLHYLMEVYFPQHNTPIWVKKIKWC